MTSVTLGRHRALLRRRAAAGRHDRGGRAVHAVPRRRGHSGWEFYARPRLGLDEPVTADDVRRLFDRQFELDRPRNIEWVDQTTPSLLPAVRNALGSAASAGAHVELEECPLLVLPPDTAMGGRRPDPGADGRRPRPADHDRRRPRRLRRQRRRRSSGHVGKRPELIEQGLLVVVAAYDDQGRVVGGGSAAPRGDAAELMGIGVPPFARRRGLGSAITRALVQAVRDRGVTTVLLSAASDDAASIYRQVGFEDVGTACILELHGG